jgi:hypothetical protein
VPAPSPLIEYGCRPRQVGAPVTSKIPILILNRNDILLSALTSGAVCPGRMAYGIRAAADHAQGSGTEVPASAMLLPTPTAPPPAVLNYPLFCGGRAKSFALHDFYARLSRG